MRGGHVARPLRGRRHRRSLRLRFGSVLVGSGSGLGTVGRLINYSDSSAAHTRAMLLLLYTRAGWV